MSFVSGLYEGEISEARAGERWRRRQAAMLFVDLDELAPLEGRLKLFPVRRLGLASKAQVEAELASAGLAHGGAIHALCAPGFAVYRCHDLRGRLSAVRYALGGEDGAWLVPARDGAAALHTQGDRHYALRTRSSGENALVAVEATDLGGGFVFAVSFIGRRRELSSWALLRTPVRRPPALAGAIAEALSAWAAEDAVAERRLAA
jgi:DUF1365 family protein